jgi:uncharacterized protein
MSETVVYTRKIYEQHLRPWIDKPLIKIITGMRRVGKSYLLRQLMNELRSRGIPEANLHLIDKESVAFDAIASYKDLVSYLKSRTASGTGRQYLLVDEVQEIEQWEKAINSYLKVGNWDIYLTGSNAHLLSSELATLLSGRYVELPVYSLSLPEFLQFNEKDVSQAQQVFPTYLRYGGFPAIHHFLQNEHTIYQFINSLYDTIVLKDIVARHSIRNVSLFQNISRFVFDSIGNTFSAKRVADYLKSQRLSISVDTVQNYLGFLTETYALHRVQRYDIKGKRYLEIYEKYYLGDIGLRNAVLGYQEPAINGLLENLVFLELKRRGFHVAIGKFGDAEIDFIATKEQEKHYYQVAYLLTSDDTIEREFGALAAVPDNYPKVVLSMDPLGSQNREGIQWHNLIEFLMGRE